MSLDLLEQVNTRPARGPGRGRASRSERVTLPAGEALHYRTTRSASGDLPTRPTSTSTSCSSGDNQLVVTRDERRAPRTPRRSRIRSRPSTRADGRRLGRELDPGRLGSPRRRRPAPRASATSASGTRPAGRARSRRTAPGRSTRACPASRIGSSRAYSEKRRVAGSRPSLLAALAHVGASASAISSGSRNT